MVESLTVENFDYVESSGHLLGMSMLSEGEVSEAGRESLTQVQVLIQSGNFFKELREVEREYVTRIDGVVPSDEELEFRSENDSELKNDPEVQAVAEVARRILSAEVKITHIKGEDMSSAVVVRQGSAVAVYFQPTVTSAEAFANLDMRKDGSYIGGEVHQGFKNILDQGKPEDAQSVSGLENDGRFIGKVNAQLKQEVADAKAEGFDELRVTVGGLSQGGALAQQAAARWMHEGDLPIAQVISWQSPSAGTTEWAQNFEMLAEQQGTRIMRFETGEDIVPHLPPQALGYEQAGELVYMPSMLDTDKMVLNPHPSYVQCDSRLQYEQLMEDGKTPLGASIAHHWNGGFHRDFHEKLEPILSLDSAMEIIKSPSNNPYILNGNDQQAIDSMKNQLACANLTTDEALSGFKPSSPRIEVSPDVVYIDK